MEKRYVACVMILIGSLFVLSLSIMFYLQQMSIAHNCTPSNVLPACYPSNGIAFSIFGFIITLILLAAAYHVYKKDANIATRWALTAMVASLLSYEVTEFAYLTNIMTPYYSSVSPLPQFIITAGYLGTLFAFCGGAIGLSIRSTNQMFEAKITPTRRKVRRKAKRTSTRKRKR
jgi:uncharacterized BrkB/YihY/UPF0761 family membrane protein